MNFKGSGWTHAGASALIGEGSKSNKAQCGCSQGLCACAASFPTCALALIGTVITPGHSLGLRLGNQSCWVSGDSVEAWLPIGGMHTCNGGAEKYIDGLSGNPVSATISRSLNTSQNLDKGLALIRFLDPIVLTHGME